MLNNKLGSYLTGLLEGDGCIYLKKNHKDVYKYLVISFTFNIHDLPFAEFLKETFNMGSIEKPLNQNAIYWSIYKIEDIVKLLNLFNGHFRTAKFITYQKALLIYKNYHNIDIPLLPFNSSNIITDAWLAGFSDADSSFLINKSQNTFSFTYQIKVSENYIKNSPDYLQYRDNRIFMELLAKIFNVNLIHGYSQFLKNTTIKTSYLYLKIVKTESLFKVIEYFTQYPIFSSKYINYCDWVKAFHLKNKIKNNKLPLNLIFNELEEIKNNMNSKRDPNTITWEHLNNFYKINL